jgi:hypothetical protein
MTLAERARLATQIRQSAAAMRALRLRRLLDEGEGLKRAAHRVGVSIRTARRYRRQA